MYRSILDSHADGYTASFVYRGSEAGTWAEIVEQQFAGMQSAAALKRAIVERYGQEAWDIFENPPPQPNTVAISVATYSSDQFEEISDPSWRPRTVAPGTAEAEVEPFQFPLRVVEIDSRWYVDPASIAPPGASAQAVLRLAKVHRDALDSAQREVAEGELPPQEIHTRLSKKFFP